jgi:rRNA-processing protein FCF1
MQMKIVVDTSFLMAQGLFRVDLMGELERVVGGKFELLVPSQVIDELRALAERGGPRERSAARMGLDLASRGKVVEAEGPADEAIFRMATENRWAVGTNDGELRRKLRRKGVPVIYLRGFSHLEMSGGPVG